MKQQTQCRKKKGWENDAVLQFAGIKKGLLPAPDQTFHNFRASKVRQSTYLMLSKTSNNEF